MNAAGEGQNRGDDIAPPSSSDIPTSLPGREQEEKKVKEGENEEGDEGFKQEDAPPPHTKPPEGWQGLTRA